MKIKQLFYLLLFFNVIVTVISVNAADIYVSLKGNDTNAGTKIKPVATLNAAIRIARELRRVNDASIKGGIRINVEEGFYQLYEAVKLRPEDSGTASSPTSIAAVPGRQVILSGGQSLKNWKKVIGKVNGLSQNAQGKVWAADVPYDLTFRQLWVNNKKAIRSKDYNGDKMGRILSWDFEKQTCRIPLTKTINFSNVEGMEMVIHQWWAIANLRVKTAKVMDNAVELSFRQPESRIQSEHPWPAPWLSTETGNSAYFLTNSIQFLDQPGEWFHDLKNHKVYYWPRGNEQMQIATAIVPNLENLLKIEGTIDNPVKYVSFKGISFQHSSWLRPSKQGHVPHQAGMYMLDAYKLAVPGTTDKRTLENQAWVGRPAAAVEVSYADFTSFESCSFEHLASTALDYKKGTHNNSIKGNLFKDIGGSAILVGQFSDEATEVHLPYNPTDTREISSNQLIENNLITNATNEDWGAVGIGAGYVSGIKISHNEINEVSYTGISLGWGWTQSVNAMKNNTIIGNKIHHYGKHLYDVSGIYTLSAQENSLITKNYIDSIYRAPYAHLPDHWFYIYTDEGSSYFTVKDNWTPSSKFLQNANGPGNLWLNNGNLVADSIRQNAGLQKEYQYLLTEKASMLASREINVDLALQKSVVFELVFAVGTKPSADELKTFCVQKNIPAEAIYSWENRFVIYTYQQHPSVMQKALALKFKEAEVKLYDNLIYDFNRKKNCDLSFAKEWGHVILSANLLSDTTLQNEYLAHHATQFEKWPELSKGFCNAEFQQLLIYKNGPQLMLIISIPKGKSLEELNPKTTENNPRVNDWNALMKKYQVGIEGTKPGEVWVFFNPLPTTNKPTN
ncbi:L-rhamnose mutarotase [Pedobacter sp. Du54]|uniref:L-rhamnose mutarotase n=1 Tax=Pedobacter anseongensis TaxID=3133439 RepID=UPI0030AED951